MLEKSFKDRKDKLSLVFSPSAPINSKNLFQGRIDQLMEVHNAVLERGEHAILHGDRGVGKTSLANILDEKYLRAKVVKFTCNKDSSLANIWFNIFRRIEVEKPNTKRKAGFNSCDDEPEVTSLSAFIRKDELDLDEINMLLEQISNSNERLLIIIDEFDQISCAETRRSFANIIKYLSDNAVNITILLVGIGFSISDLLSEHQSVERCLRQVKLERMSDEELEEIINHAEKELDMNIEKRLKAKVISYSNGFPHFTHLIGKYIFLEAINEESRDIKLKHFKNGLRRSLENVNESIKNAYLKGISSHKNDAIFKDVLYACALSKTDEQNTFKASDLEVIFNNELKQQRKQQSFQYHLGKLCSEERGKILESINNIGMRKRYRFSNPLMKAYVILQYHINKKKSE